MEDAGNQIVENRFSRHKTVTLIIFVAVLVLVLDLAAGYIFLDQPKENLARIINPYYNHTLKPYYDDVESWGAGPYKLVANSLGFKDNSPREVSLATTTANRVVFLGDSFTEGIGIGYDETFVGRIGRELAPLGYEVLNAGIASYSPKIYYLKMKYWIEQGLKFDDLVVFVDLSDTQDEIAYEDWNPTTPYSLRSYWEKYSHKIDYFLEHHSMLYLHGLRPVLLGEDKRKLRAFFFGGGRMTEEELKYIADRGRWTFDDSVFNEWGKEGVALELENMDRLYNLAKANNITMSVAVYPWPVTIENSDFNSRHVKIWKKFAAERNISFYNLFTPFFATTTPVKDEIALYYLPQDTHWTSAGHEVVAKNWLKQFLRERTAKAFREY